MGQARSSMGKWQERVQTRVTTSEVLHHCPTTPHKLSLVWVVIRLGPSETGNMRILRLVVQSERVALGTGKRKEGRACGAGRETGVDGWIGVAEWIRWVVGFLIGFGPLTVFWAEEIVLLGLLLRQGPGDVVNAIRHILAEKEENTNINRI